MSQNVLPVESDAAAAPAEAAPHGARALHDHLSSAFSADPPVPACAADSTSSAVTRSLAAAAMRQAQAFQEFVKRVDHLDRSTDMASLQQGMRGLCEALLHITIQTKQAAAETESKFESLSEAMAVISGHMASHRAEIQGSTAATNALSADLRRLDEEMAAHRTEISQLRELIGGNGQAVAELRDKEEKVCGRFAVLANEVEAAKQQLATLIEGSEGVAQRLQAAEQAVTALSRREKILAALHTRAARTLKVGA